MEIKFIAIDKLKRDKNQPRQTIDHDKIADMAQSIKTEGVINPIEISADYVIITGEMRWRAAKLAGLKEVPCKILKINPTERFRRQVIENIHHNTMTDWDTAKALEQLRQGVLASLGESKHGGRPNEGIRELARMIGKSRDYIADHLEIIKVSPALQKVLQKDLIPYTLIRAVSSTPVAYQKLMEQKIIKGEFQTREAALEVAAALSRTPEKGATILEKDFTKKTAKEIGDSLSKISPRFPDIIEKRLAPGQEFIKIKNELLDWLTSNPPHRIIQMDKVTIILGLSLITERINQWQKNANQLKLK